MTRAFVATYPSPEAIEHLDGFLEVRRESGPFRWTLPTQWHLTLAFFEDVPERSFDALVEGLAAAVGKRSAMRASIAGGGAFPHVGRAKVLWAGVDVGDAAELGNWPKGAVPPGQLRERRRRASGFVRTSRSPGSVRRLRPPNGCASSMRTAGRNG